MRFYDVSSSTDRRRALDDLIGKNDKNHHPNNNYKNNVKNNENNVKNIWIKLPNEWRRDKEFVLTVLRVTAPDPAAAATVVVSSSEVNEDNDFDDNNNEYKEDDESSDEEEEEDDDVNNESNVSFSTNSISSSSINIPSLPSKSEFERLFPQSLRFDRDVVLAWARRSDFPKLYNSRHLFLPPCLSNDKEVCLEYCRQIPRSLQDCHVDLCDDITLVTAAIEQCGGLELQYASYRLQCEESVVRKACSSDGKALSFCPPICDAFIHITSDRNFMLKVVLGSDDDGDGRRKTKRRGRSSSSGTMWRLLDKSIKETDEELALQALRNGLALRDVPKQFVDAAFLKRALTNNSVPLYLELSPKWQSIDEIALEAVIANDSTPEVHSKAFELNDDDSVYLRDHRDVVLAVCQRGSVELLRELLGQPVEIPIVNGDNNIQPPDLNQFLQLMRVAMPDRNNNVNANINANVNRNNNNNNNNNNNANNGINGANAIANAIVNANIDVNDENNAIRFDMNDLNDANMMDNGDEDDLNNNAIADANFDNHFNDIMNLIVPPQRPIMVHTRRRRPPSKFLDDYDVMRVAVAKDPRIFGNASMRLRENVDIILASIADGPSAWIRLKNIPWDVQRKNPAITIRCLNFMESKNLRYLPNYVPNDVWTANRDLRVAWIRRKGNILLCFYPGITTDEALALEVARYTWTQLYKVGDAFLTDKQFVMKALELDGRCIKHVPAELKNKFDVLTVAAANYYTRYDYEVAAAAAMKKKKRTEDDSSSTDSSTDQMLTIASMGRAFHFLDIDQLKAKIIRKLELHDTFVLEFLRGIAIDSSSPLSPRRGPRGPPALRSQLTMLDRGVETSEAFKRLIAEYLAVPLGKELTSLRNALVNIKRSAPIGDANDHNNSQDTTPLLYRLHRRVAPMLARDNAAGNNMNNGDQQDAPRFVGPQQRRIRPLRRAGADAERPVQWLHE